MFLDRKLIPVFFEWRRELISFLNKVPIKELKRPPVARLEKSLFENDKLRLF